MKMQVEDNGSNGKVDILGVAIFSKRQVYCGVRMSGVELSIVTSNLIINFFKPFYFLTFLPCSFIIFPSFFWHLTHLIHVFSQLKLQEKLAINYL
jgi:hypothetical protein